MGGHRSRTQSASAAGRVAVDGAGLPSNGIRALSVDASGTLWIGTPAASRRLRNGASAPPRQPIAQSSRSARRGGALYSRPRTRPQVYANSNERRRGRSAGAPQRRRDLHRCAGRGLARHGWRRPLALDHGQIGGTPFATDSSTTRSTPSSATARAGCGWPAASGIFSVERAQLLQFRPGHRSQGASTPYSPTDALRTIECQHGVQPAAWAAADGKLWFSTSRGLLMLDSRNAERQFEAPPAAIEDVTVNGERRGMPATSARSRPGATTSRSVTPA